ATPALMVEVPLHGFCQAALEGFPRRPAQLALDLAGVDGVAVIVAGSIGHKRDELTMRHVGRLRHELIEQRTERFDHLDVPSLIPPADVIGLPHRAFFYDLD